MFQERYISTCILLGCDVMFWCGRIRTFRKTMATSFFRMKSLEFRVQSYFTTDGRSVGQSISLSVLVSHPSGTYDQTLVVMRTIGGFCVMECPPCGENGSLLQKVIVLVRLCQAIRTYIYVLFRFLYTECLCTRQAFQLRVCTVAYAWHFHTT
jgi:hypothetical protein